MAAAARRRGADAASVNVPGLIKRLGLEESDVRSRVAQFESLMAEASARFRVVGSDDDSEALRESVRAATSAAAGILRDAIKDVNTVLTACYRAHGGGGGGFGASAAAVAGGAVGEQRRLEATSIRLNQADAMFVKMERDMEGTMRSTPLAAAVLLLRRPPHSAARATQQQQQRRRWRPTTRARMAAMIGTLAPPPQRLPRRRAQWRSHAAILHAVRLRCGKILLENARYVSHRGLRVATWRGRMWSSCVRVCVRARARANVCVRGCSMMCVKSVLLCITVWLHESGALRRGSAGGNIWRGNRDGSREGNF